MTLLVSTKCIVSFTNLNNWFFSSFSICLSWFCHWWAKGIIAIWTQKSQRRGPLSALLTPPSFLNFRPPYDLSSCFSESTHWGCLYSVGRGNWTDLRECAWSMPLAGLPASEFSKQQFCALQQYLCTSLWNPAVWKIHPVCPSSLSKVIFILYHRDIFLCSCYSQEPWLLLSFIATTMELFCISSSLPKYLSFQGLWHELNVLHIKVKIHRWLMHHLYGDFRVVYSRHDIV